MMKIENQLKAHVTKMLKDQAKLFVTDVDKEMLWNTYLDSFPEGTNQIFRKRREYDCSCCRHFIRDFGNVVAIKGTRLVSIWDFEPHDAKFKPVFEKVSAYVKSAPISDVFVTKVSIIGTEKTYEQLDDGRVHTWTHFNVDFPKRFVTSSGESKAALASEYRVIKSVLKRSLEEISLDAIDTVLDLIAQKSLYKGDEWRGVLSKFRKLHRSYRESVETEKENFCWKASIEVGAVIGKIRNHSMGVLLTDITNRVDLNDAVRKYEAIVAPTNYKRPKAIFTKKMIKQAQKKIMELGYLDSLERRYATIDDITVNNILFANRDTLKMMSGDIFSELETQAVSKPKAFDRVEEVPVERFVNDILPRLTRLEVLFENKHVPSLVSVVAPKVKNSPTMFKWGNGFSWAYNGNITDSMKQRVKAAGGNVDGVLRFSLQWNENSDNRNDFDAHCVEPNKNHIWYQNKGQRHPSTAMLDVDIVHPGIDQVAVENITWTDKRRMQEGVYTFYVKNFSHRGGRSGFSAEIEYDGQIYAYDYSDELRQDEEVIVAKVRFSKEKGIEFVESLPSSQSSKHVWNIQTNQFHPVSVCMYSPNYWDEQVGIGHRHYFFILKGCTNDTNPNGFFNEFLREDLLEHKRVFEALGRKKQVEPSDSQLSGLGFSATKRNELVCKLEGHVNRTIKVIF